MDSRLRGKDGGRSGSNSNETSISVNGYENFESSYADALPSLLTRLVISRNNVLHQSVSHNIFRL